MQALRPSGTGWQAVSTDGSVAAQAPLVVLAAGHATAALAGPATLPLQAVRGQLTFAHHPAASDLTGADPFPAVEWPRHPVNGDGSLLPAIPLGNRQVSVFGATYGRDDAATDLRPHEHRENVARLRALLPQWCERLAEPPAVEEWQGWAGVRAMSPDRLPIVGPLAAPAGAGASQTGHVPLWVCTAMGSHGLSHAIGCAELLAARLFGEPLALEPALAEALDARRFRR